MRIISKLLTIALALTMCSVSNKTYGVYAKSFNEGWTTTNVNVRKKPSTDSDILETYPFNTEILYTDYNKKWVKIRYGNRFAYMSKNYISDKKREYKDIVVPSNNGFKSYMPYTAITATYSEQYVLQANEAYTGNYGIRQINGRYCVAIGSYFTSDIGTYFDLILENGAVIPCILADQKANEDTDSYNIATRHNGCVSEFIVDTESLSHDAKLNGDISYCRSDWNSPVSTVRIYK